MAPEEARRTWNYFSAR